MILFFIIIFPIICGILCPFVEIINTKFPKWISIICIGIILISSLLLWYNEMSVHPILNDFFILNKSFVVNWINDLNIFFNLFIDKFSLLMITITGILGFTSVLCSWNEYKKYQGLFYLNLLFLFGSTTGIFLSSDLFLFLFFWELTLIPIYFLVSIWGNDVYTLEERFTASNKFFLYLHASGMIMLISIISLVLVHCNSTNILTFNYQELLYHSNFSEKISYLLMIGFFLSFAIKMPIIPFHSWLIHLQQNSSTSGSVELVSILLKTPIYGIIKFCLLLFPKLSNQFANIIQYIGLLIIFYGSIIAISQTNIKKFVSYINIVHVGFVLITIYSRSFVSSFGTIVQMISYILSSSGLVIICGQLHRRFQTYEISYMNGIWSNIKILPAFLLFFFLSVIGIPGTGNFSSEIITLLGIFSMNRVVGILLLFGIIMSSIACINLIREMYYYNRETKQIYPVVTTLEKLTVIPIIFLLLLAGIFPNFFRLIL